MGDYDCDGADLNSRTRDCTCENPEIVCPTDPLVVAPYPDPASLPLIDGSTWIQGGLVASAWRWELTGGDCDNILPHPSFQIYANQGATGQVPVGGRATGLGPNSNQTGLRFGPGGIAGPKIYPAFALSGDYLAKGMFIVAGQLRECTVRVQVRAPGLRAEACWTDMGALGGNDVDLHVARLQGATCTGKGHGWFATCRGVVSAETSAPADDLGDDCYYVSTTGCTNFATNPSSWGYARSATGVCHGWGSNRSAAAGCDNPRLDLDNRTCDANIKDPSAAGLLGLGSFCAAENINIDNPKHGDRFAIATHAYSLASEVMPHVNVYCNGERRLSLGHDPTAGQNFPVLKTDGRDPGGDLWEAAIVEAIVDGSGVMTDCVVAPVNSASPKPGRDGTSDHCVDTNPRNSATTGADEWLFMASGEYPVNPNDLCWH